MSSCRQMAKASEIQSRILLHGDIGFMSSLACQSGSVMPEIWAPHTLHRHCNICNSAACPMCCPGCALLCTVKFSQRCSANTSLASWHLSSSTSSWPFSGLAEGNQARRSRCMCQPTRKSGHQRNSVLHGKAYQSEPMWLAAHCRIYDCLLDLTTSLQSCRRNLPVWLLLTWWVRQVQASRQLEL